MNRRDRLIEAEVAELSPELQKEFRSIVSKGNTREFALMCISRQGAIYGNCERTFWESQHHAMSREMDQKERNVLVAAAAKAGINTEGKTYLGAIGKVNDPLAWVGSRDDAVQALRKKGKSTDGILKVKSSPVKGDEPGPRLAPDIVARFERKYLSNRKVREDLKRGRLKRQGLREMIVEHHAPKK